MVPYVGRHSAKMYIRGKSIKFVYKLWVLASLQAYPFNLQVYVRKEKNNNKRLKLESFYHMFD